MTGVPFVQRSGLGPAGASFFAVVAASSAALFPSSASADTFGGQVHYVVGRGALDGHELELSSFDQLPRGVRIAGGGVVKGADFRFDALPNPMRIGIGVGLFDVEGLDLSHEPLPPGVDLDLSGAGGASIELFLGRELGQGPVYPYLDLRATFTLLVTSVDVAVDPYGRVGEVDASSFVAGLGPRIGCLLPIGHSFMVDVAGYQRVFGGVESQTLFVGLAYWENDRTDPFSEELRRSWRGDI